LKADGPSTWNIPELGVPGKVLCMSRRDWWTGREEADDLLQELDGLQRFTRAVRHGFWMPLVLLGLLMIGATPLYLSPSSQTPLGVSGGVVFKVRAGASSSGYLPLCHAVHGVVTMPCKPIIAGSRYFPSGVTTSSPRAIAIYWLIALPLAYVVVAAWAHRRAFRRGVATSMLSYAVTGVALVALLVLAGVLTGAWSRADEVSSIGNRGLGALFVVALGLLVLAYRERSSAMWAFSIVFLGYVVLINLYDLDNLTARLGLTVGPEIAVFLAGVFTFLAGVTFAVRQEQVT
jgi:hypothetical protein